MTTASSDHGAERWRGRPIYPTRERLAAAVALGSTVGAVVSGLPEEAAAGLRDPRAIALALSQSADPQRLVQSLLEWIPAAEMQLVEGNLEVLPLWIASLVMLAEGAMTAPESPLASYVPQALARARARTTQWQLPGARSWIELAQAQEAFSRREYGLARMYAIAAETSSAAAVDSNPNDLPPAEETALAQILSLVATAALEGRAPAPAAELARLALAHHATHDQALYVLAQALGQLEKWEESADAWRRYAALVPDRPTGHINEALAVARMGEMDRAVAAADTAVRLAPQDARMYLARGTIREAAGRMSEAAADFRAAFRLAADRVAKGEDPTDPHGRQSMFNALSRLLANLQRSGNVNGMRAEIEELKASDRVEWREAGHFYGAQLALLSGDEEAALADLAAAIEIDPHDMASRAMRVRIHLGRRDVRAAEADLRYIGARERNAEQVVELLDPYIEQHPGDLLARKWRGYANHQRQHAIAAKPDLVQALAGMPDDLDLQYWLALADLVMVPVDLEDPKLDEIGIDVDKVTDALRRLAAVAAQTGDQEQLRVYRWFVDRLGLSRGLLAALADAPDEPGGWFTVSPNVRTALAQYRQGIELNARRLWRDAADLLASAAATFQEDGYPCLSAMISLHLADTCIRLYDLDRARVAFDAAERMTYLRNQSLSTIFQTSSEFVSRKSEDRQTLNIELEYFPIYGVGITEFDLPFRVLKADLLNRLGAVSQALQELGDVDDLCRQAAEVGNFRLTFTSFTIFRDARRFEEAERLAAEAELQARDPVSKATLENGLAIMHMHRDDYPAAEAAVRRAIAALGQTDTESDVTLRTMLAQMLYLQGKHDQALELIETLAGTQWRSLNDEVVVRSLRASIYHAVGRDDEATREFNESLAVVDQLRERLDLNDRKTWQQRFAQYFETGVLRALGKGDARLAFDLLERSRGRALLDEVVSDAEVSSEVKRLLERREKNERRLVALDALLAAQKSDLVDYELVRAAASDDSAVPDLVTEGGTLSVPAAEKMRDDVRRNLSAIGEKIARSETDRTQFRAGSTATFDDVQALLRASDSPVVFVSWLITVEATYVFVIRRDVDTPGVAAVPVPSADVRAAAQEWTKAIRAGDPSPEPDDALRRILEPLLELTAAGETLWIVPPAAAYDVPLHAMDIGGECLIDRNPVVYTPAGSIMRACRDVPRRTLTNALIVGDPLGDLPFAREEAERVAALAAVEPLIGRAATPEAVQAYAARGAIDLMHFAAHGWFEESDAMRSGIVLAAPVGALTEEDILTAEDLRRMDFDTDLIVVSGCETGRSSVDPGEEMMGLTRGLLIAGTRSLVVSMWNVADISTTFLMRRFYEGLIHRGLERAEALRDSQRWLRTLTASEVVEELDRDAADAARAGDERRYVMLRAATASTLAAQGNEARALAICEELLVRAGASNQAGVAKQVAALAGSIRQRQSRTAYDEHPFSAPFYWAPFILVGSWD